MSEFAVVGGVYRERCLLPARSDYTWGSGGRAAATLSGLGQEVILHTAVDKRNAAILESLAETFKFRTKPQPVTTSPEFRYEHGLSTPTILPHVLPDPVRIEAEADNLLVFGMLEAVSQVRGKRVVYDPQNPISPRPIELDLGKPTLAYVLNTAEAKGLTGFVDPLRASAHIAKNFGAHVVVIKRGAQGAMVYENGQAELVPAYRTEYVWPIGSGDVFAAAFAAHWAGKGWSAVEAANRASRATALYCDSRVLPISSEEIDDKGGFSLPLLSIADAGLSDSEFHVYLAGPFSNIAQRWLVEESLGALTGMGLKVFSPLHHVGPGEAQQVAPLDLEGVRRSRVIFALFDGLDAGTVFEMGYARSIGKPVVVLSESTPEEPLKMVSGSGCEVVPDFVSAIYRTAWKARE